MTQDVLYPQGPGHRLYEHSTDAILACRPITPDMQLRLYRI